MNPLDMFGLAAAGVTAFAFFLRQSLINLLKVEAADVQRQLQCQLERDLAEKRQLRIYIERLTERIDQVQGISMPKVIGTKDSLHKEFRDLDDHFRKGGDLNTPPGGPYPFEAVDIEDMEVSYDPAQRTRRHIEAPSSAHPYREPPLMVVLTKRETGFVASLKAVIRKIFGR